MVCEAGVCRNSVVHLFLLLPSERKGGRPAPQKGSTKLVVRNLAFEATRQELAELFGAFGQIKSVRIPVKKFDGSHRGYGKRGDGVVHV